MSSNDLTQALALKKDDPFILYKRGLVFYLMKDYKNAIRDLQASLEFGLEERYKANAFYHIGLAFACLNKFSEAFEPFTSVNFFLIYDLFLGD